MDELRAEQILYEMNARSRALELRAIGHSPSEAVDIMNWERDLIVARARPSKTGSDTTSDIKNSSAGNHERERNAEVLALRDERDALRVRLEKTEAALAKAQAKLSQREVSGKRFQTALKIVYLKGVDLEFDPGRNNTAVSKIVRQLADCSIRGDDDEAFRDALKAAFERKKGGFWDIDSKSKPNTAIK